MFSLNLTRSISSRYLNNLAGLARNPPPLLYSDRSSVQASSLGAQIALLADRRRTFGQDLIAPDSLVYTEISPIVSPAHSPSRRILGDKEEHDTAVEDLQEKYQSLLRRFEKTVQMSSEALNLSRLSQGIIC